MSKTEQTLFAKKISNYIKSNNRFDVIRYGDIGMYKALTWKLLFNRKIYKTTNYSCLNAK